MKRKTILIVCDGLPYPPNDGVRTRVYNISNQLLKEFDLKIVSIIKNKSELILLDEAQYFLNNSIVPVSVDFNIWKKIYVLIVNIFEIKPLEYHFYYFKDVAKIIDNLIKNETINFVQFERSFLSSYSTCIPKEVPRVINVYDYETLRHKRLVNLAPFWKKPLSFYNWKRVKDFENKSLLKSNHIFAISEKERDAILNSTHVNKEKISLLTGGINMEDYPFIKSYPKQKNIIFIGSGMRFNYDAIKYFYYQVFPKIKNMFAEIKWYLVGKLERKHLSYLLNDPNVEFFSNVPNVIPYYEKCRLLVVPLRGGGGTRIKILEAMAVGRPIVSTSIGCEGIDVTNNENILIADDANQFALAVCELLDNDSKSDLIRTNAYTFVKKYYNWSQACKPLTNYYRENTDG